MAASYMGHVPHQNGYVRGLRFPPMKLGQFSMNVVVQASACCGKDTVLDDWTEPGGLVMAGPEAGTNTQRRLGILGTIEDAGVGLHRMGKFDGNSGPAEMKPQILGFTFKEGRLTTFKNGVKVSTVAAHGTAFQAYSWINGWLDQQTGPTNPLEPGYKAPEPRGQLAELKLYSIPLSDAQMVRLHRLLDCKWGVSGAQTDDWATCENAAGDGGGGGGDIVAGPAMVVWSREDLMQGDKLLPVGDFTFYRDGKPQPEILRLSNFGGYTFLYYQDAEGVPWPKEEQPTWAITPESPTGGILYGWDLVESALLPSIPGGADNLPPGCSLLVGPPGVEAISSKGDRRALGLRGVNVTHTVLESVVIPKDYPGGICESERCPIPGITAFPSGVSFTSTYTFNNDRLENGVLNMTGPTFIGLQHYEVPTLDRSAPCNVYTCGNYTDSYCMVQATSSDGVEMRADIFGEAPVDWGTTITYKSMTTQSRIADHRAQNISGEPDEVVLPLYPGDEINGHLHHWESITGRFPGGTTTATLSPKYDDPGSTYAFLPPLPGVIV